MSNYYMMDCWGLDGDERTQKPQNANLDFDEDDSVQFFVGLPLRVNLPIPLELEWDPDISGGGAAWEEFGKPSSGPRNQLGIRRQWAYPANDPPLFHREIISALRECGVDNFQAFETRITDVYSGEICCDYLAVNFLGLVKAADPSKSKAVTHSEDGLIDTDFEPVSINEAATRGLLLFRMAECVTALVVHVRVKEHLEAKGGFELVFTPPEKWIG